MGGQERAPGTCRSGLSAWVVHRATAGASVFHRAVLDEKFSETRGTVVAARGHGGWVESVSEVLMRDRAADALRRFPAAAAAAGMAVLLVTACTGAATPTASPWETKVETPAERDARLAGEAVVKYWAVVDDLAANPTKSLNLLDPVARDQARAQMQTLLGTYAAKGLTQTGRSSLTDLQATTDDGKSFAVSACVDVSGVDLVNEQGVSQVNPDRPEQQSFSYTVVKADGGFFVTRDSLKGSSC